MPTIEMTGNGLVIKGTGPVDQEILKAREKKRKIRGAVIPVKRRPVKVTGAGLVATVREEETYLAENGIA